MEKPFVLVADDNEATLTLITAVLRNDFIVDVARDGTEAIAKLKNRRYAVTILDLLMPNVDGFAVLDFLRDEREEHLDSVIVVTAALARRERERLQSYGVKVVAKPFEIDVLLDTAKECAARGGWDGGRRGPFLANGVMVLLADLLQRGM